MNLYFRPLTSLFILCLNIYQYDVVTLSETWLRNNQYQIEHVQISEYTLRFKNREERREGGGRVAIYLRKYLKYRKGTDIEMSNQI